jgi:CBS domain-containing protein
MSYHARDIMNPAVISVPTTMDLRDLGKLFLEKGISGAPVVDDEGNLAGVISQTDLVYYSLTRGDELVVDSHFYQNARVEGRHIPGGFQLEDANSGCVADVMTPVVHAVAESATVESVARLMTRKHIHRVIVQRGRKVAGIISALDVLRLHTAAGKEPRKTRRSASAGAGARSAARKRKPARARVNRA